MNVFVIILLCIGLSGAAAGAPFEIQEKPILQLDTGGHQGLIMGLAFTPDGKFIVSASEDKIIRVWDWRKGVTVRTIRGQSLPGIEGRITAMALSSDGRWIAVGGRMSAPGKAGYDIRLYDFATGELKALLRGHKGVVNCLAFSPDGKKIISGGGDKAAFFWDIASISEAGVELLTPINSLEGHRGAINAVAFTPDGERALTAGDDQSVRLWQVTRGVLMKEMAGHVDKIFALAVSPNGGNIASGDSSGTIHFWDGRNGEPLKAIGSQGNEVGSLAYSPDGRLLLATCGLCDAQKQRIYDAASGNELIAYAEHDDTVFASTFSPDGSLVATGGGSQYPIHVWGAANGQTKAVLKGTGEPIWAAGFSSDGHRIAWGTQVPCSSGDCPDATAILQYFVSLPEGSQTLSQPEPVATQEGWIRAITSVGALSLKEGKRGADGMRDPRDRETRCTSRDIYYAGTGRWLRAYGL